MIKKTHTLLVGAFALAFASNVATAADKPRDRNTAKASKDGSASMDASNVNQLIAGWPERPRLGALMMIGKYGPPQHVTAEQLVWENQGPYKRITVTKLETPHDFPKPHMDFLEHTVSYQIPAGKADEITEFDGSATFSRTEGELSGKCDLEGHNILTLNLANDIATGKMSAKEARKAFSENVVEDTLGNNPAYVTTLQFQPASKAAADPDKPTIPGSPVRATMTNDLSKTTRSNMGDAEVLGIIIAVDENEIIAAAEAQKKKVSPEVKAYAKKLHQEHGKNAVATIKLGEKIDTTPVETAAVDQLRIKGAGELAMLLPKEGDEFGSAYMAAMVKNHEEVLTMIDQKLTPMAKSEELKEHLTKTRGHIAMHLEEAKKIHSGMKR